MRSSAAACRPSPRSTAPAPAAGRASPRAAACGSPRAAPTTALRGGASIAACCDRRIASRSIKYGFPVARTLGNCLSLPSYNRLVYLVGPALVKDIVFQARLIEADEALAKGLVMELTENQKTLLKPAEGITRLGASHAPLTLQATKEALLRLRPKVAHGEGNDLVL